MAGWLAGLPRLAGMSLRRFGSSMRSAGGFFVSWAWAFCLATERDICNELEEGVIRRGGLAGRDHETFTEVVASSSTRWGMVDFWCEDKIDFDRRNKDMPPQGSGLDCYFGSLGYAEHVPSVALSRRAEVRPSITPPLPHEEKRFPPASSQVLCSAVPYRCQRAY